eukprot:GHUV01043916.1.p1 GENE.GHUV01043916.1~~GHUV01043916.1.p1  ORF type:complete len:160 (+),score=27.21 GHUV01043916.1:224-703(+)
MTVKALPKSNTDDNPSCSTQFSCTRCTVTQLLVVTVHAHTAQQPAQRCTNCLNMGRRLTLTSILMTGTYASVTASSSLTSGWRCRQSMNRLIGKTIRTASIPCTAASCCYCWHTPNNSMALHDRLLHTTARCQGGSSNMPLYPHCSKLLLSAATSKYDC